MEHQDDTWSRKTLRDELLGLPLMGVPIKITSSTNVNDVGIEGVIVYESVGLIHVRTVSGAIKRLLKPNIGMQCRYRGKLLYMDGRLLSSTTIHRLKKLK